MKNILYLRDYITNMIVIYDVENIFSKHIL